MCISDIQAGFNKKVEIGVKEERSEFQKQVR